MDQESPLPKPLILNEALEETASFRPNYKSSHLNNDT
jgi:hypothetical protein